MSTISHEKKVKKETVLCDTKMYLKLLSLNSTAAIEAIFSGLGFRAHKLPELLLPYQGQRQLGTLLPLRGKSSADEY